MRRDPSTPAAAWPARARAGWIAARARLPGALRRGLALARSRPDAVLTVALVAGVLVAVVHWG